MSAVVAKTIPAPGLSATVSTVVALVALVLAAAGLYGVLAFTVGQRRHEIGVRMALARSHAWWWGALAPTHDQSRVEPRPEKRITRKQVKRLERIFKDLDESPLRISDALGWPNASEMAKCPARCVRACGC